MTKAAGISLWGTHLPSPTEHPVSCLPGWELPSSITDG